MGYANTNAKVEVNGEFRSTINWLQPYDLDDLSERLRVNLYELKPIFSKIESDGFVFYKETPNIKTELWNGSTVLKNLERIFEACECDKIYYKKLPVRDDRFNLYGEKKKGSVSSWRSYKSYTVRTAKDYRDNSVSIKW